MGTAWGEQLLRDDAQGRTTIRRPPMRHRGTAAAQRRPPAVHLGDDRQHRSGERPTERKAVEQIKPAEYVSMDGTRFSVVPMEEHRGADSPCIVDIIYADGHIAIDDVRYHSVAAANNAAMERRDNYDRWVSGGER